MFTSGCLKDTTAAVQHSTGHNESVEAQLVAGQHSLNPHSCGLLVGVGDPDLGKGRE